MALSIGMGLTNDCNLRCAHCYRPTDEVSFLSLEDVALVCDSLPVDSIGLGTGENALHPKFLEIVAYLHERGIRLSIASNGYSLNNLPDEYLKFFHDVELSIDFPSEQEQDTFRGHGNWRDVHRALARSVNAGLRVSILATMMNTNYYQMGQLAALARAMGVNLRVNVYQPVQNAVFSLTYSEFWEGFRRLLANSSLVSCTEPVVNAVLGGDVVHTCGIESVRITPQGHVIPCVYWRDSELRLEDLRRLGVGILDTPVFQSARRIPPSATHCLCQGGCAGRRALLGDLDQHDIYCPWIRGDTIHLNHTFAPATDLVRKRNYCTTIVQ